MDSSLIIGQIGNAASAANEPVSSRIICFNSWAVSGLQIACKYTQQLVGRNRRFAVNVDDHLIRAAFAEPCDADPSLI